MLNITDEIAKDALPHMQQFLDDRPTSFPDVMSCIRYRFMNKQVRNNRSVGVSTPDLIVPMQDTITEEIKYVWKTDLAATVPFWEQWFENLNACFLGLQARKWLFLSSNQNLDNELYG